MTRYLLNALFSEADFAKQIPMLLLFLGVANILNAQLQVQTTVKESRCSANGQIILKTTGGTAPYSYLLVGSVRPPQTNDTFNLLPPATYTIRVTDNNGVNREIIAIVTGNYQEPSIQCTVTGLTVQLTPSGGRPPYRYAYSPFGNTNFGTPQYNPTFPCLPNGTHTFRIYDSCDNFFSLPCKIDVPQLRNTTTCSQINGKTTIKTTSFGGGEPPYLFTCITNNKDTFRNTTGNFNQLEGCAFTFIFSDKCNQNVQVFKCSDLEGIVKCANFKDRTASVYATGGNPPYTYRSLDMTQVNTNGQFTNLPARNDVFYNFEVSDSCGHSQTFTVSSMDLYEVQGNSCPYSGNIVVKIKQTVPQPDTCGKGCSMFYPYRFECLDCVPRRSFTDSGFVRERSYIPSVNVSPLPQGTFRFNVFNGCRDSVQIIVETKKTPPALTAAYNCSTKTIRAETGLMGVTYILRDSLKRIIATNTTGIFNAPYIGPYNIDAFYPDCDTAHYFLLAVPRPTSICFAMSSKPNASGSCDFKWKLNALSLTTTNYQLSGGPNNINIAQNNGSFTDLEPNSTYILKTSCTIDTLKTKAAVLPNLTVTAFATCSGLSAMQAKGGRSEAGCLQTYRDSYRIYNNQNVLVASNLTGYFDSLKAGDTYQIKLQNPEGCFVQTVTLKATSYQRPNLTATYGVLCAAGQTGGNIRAILRGGTPPFTFQIINPAGIRPPIMSADSSVLFQNLPAGNYTLKAFDACGNSSDYATSVGTLTLKPTSKRLCDGTLVVEAPAIDSAVYKWTNAAGTTVGTNRLLETKDSTAQTYSININTPQPCTFSSTINVPRYTPRESLGITPQLTAQYCGDSLALNPKGDTASKYQWQWQNVACPTCRNPRIFPLSTPLYYVTVTDTITKCVVKDSVKVQIEGFFTERIPNAFTPNNDGLNDIFNVLPDNCIKTVRRLRIYSRWGNLVFDKTDISPQRKEGWDGLKDAQVLGADVYVYLMDIEFQDGTFKKVSGEVSLLH